VFDGVAESKLVEAGNSVKTAMVMIQKSSSKDDALIMLEQADGILRRVLK
jgi:N-acetylmuramic acid 6-phosphate (MurNAc-6-P) etherase